MNTQTTNTTATTTANKHNWTDVKAKIKVKFGKLTEESIESAKDNLDLLASKIESAYSYGRDQAQKELSRFKETLNSESAVKEDAKPASAEPVTAQAATPVNKVA